jgi:hypothetical protein
MCRRAIINLPVDRASKNATICAPLTDCYPLYLALVRNRKTYADLEHRVFARTTDFLRLSICPILSTITNKDRLATGSTDALRASFIRIGEQMKGRISAYAYRLDDALGRIAVSGQEFDVLGEVGKVAAFPPFPAGIDCHTAILQEPCNGELVWTA